MNKQIAPGNTLNIVTPFGTNSVTVVALYQLSYGSVVEVIDEHSSKQWLDVSRIKLAE